jgi:hypothetical protein
MPPERTNSPYYITLTPRGATVVCAAHIVTDEIKEEEARALVAALNSEFETRMKQ